MLSFSFIFLSVMHRQIHLTLPPIPIPIPIPVREKKLVSVFTSSSGRWVGHGGEEGRGGADGSLRSRMLYVLQTSHIIPI